MAKWIEKGKNEGEMIVTLGGSKWANAKIAAMNVLKRAGKELNDDNITEAALNSYLDDMFADGLKELNLTPATLPEIEVRNTTADSVTVCFTFALSPEVKLGDYSGIEYKVEDYSVTDDEVDAGIAMYMERRAQEAGPDKTRSEAQSSGIVLTGDTRKVSSAADEIKVPELDDSYVKSLKIQGVSTVDGFKTYMKNFLSKSKKLFNEQEAESRMVEELLSVTEVEIPDRMVMSEVSTMLQTLASSLGQQNITLKEYLDQNGESEEQLVAELRPEAEKKVKTSLALEAVAKDKNLYPSNSEIEGEYKAMAVRYNLDVEQIKQVMPANQVSYTLMLKKTMDYLKSMNKH